MQGTGHQGAEVASMQKSIRWPTCIVQLQGYQCASVADSSATNLAGRHQTKHRPGCSSSLFVLQSADCSCKRLWRGWSSNADEQALDQDRAKHSVRS